ncbi:hypothetical protein [Actinomadura bangladeshensis]|uniref:Uncharacterized protein n=1 Tax=Actinomadura bangladeshensis TaxID=453573 RepID=A0A4R4NZ24_9ACTN|nr:hypothetical protein [Actinomadura bangladeshensis]TDC12802.1 hypothetical protein E1284_22175 [Actinomadura bangladeshensis]
MGDIGWLGRTVLIVVGTVAAAGAVTALLLASTDSSGPAEDAAERRAGARTLPGNTPAQLAVVRACMVGDPLVTAPIEDDPVNTFRLTGPGTSVSDFRVLAESVRDSRGRTVLLGSGTAYRLCMLDRSGKPTTNDRAPNQSAHVWGVPLTIVPDHVLYDDTGGGDLRFDDPGSKDGWELHVAGRVIPGGTRITFTGPDGKSAEAPVTDRFFVLRRSGGGASGPLPGSQMVPVTVKLYNGDRVVKEYSTQVDSAIMA